MGKVLSTVAHYCPEAVTAPICDAYNRRIEKRKRESDSSEEAELLESLHLPKRMKLQCTAQYIYQALFVEGKESDITVHILNKNWKLHKVYLGQSQYFSSMFSGSWNETNKSYISIEVQDPQITEEALSTVFGSFYLDEVKLEPCSVVGVLAAATMFQMDGLIDQCHDIMLESVCPLTAIQYYQAATNYGLKKIKEKVLDWFLVNFTEYFTKTSKRLKDIECDLMLEIVGHPNLNVIQTEMTLYCVLRKWLYLQVNLEASDECNNKECETFFKKIKGEIPFLLTERGQDYFDVFSHIRMYNLILNLYDIPIVVADGIVPEMWLLDSYRKQWLTMLDVFTGNKGVSHLDEDYFLKNCYRCGRVIAEGDTHSWRWSGFSFGIDLVWTLNDHTVSLRRQRTQIDFSNSNTPHSIFLKIEVLNLDERRQVKRCASSGIMSVSLARGQEIKVLTLDKDIEFPMYFCMKLLISDRERKKE